MFTNCPHCRTVFKIYTDQLAQANGQVRCGVCNRVFNGLESLSEHLATPPARAADGTDAVPITTQEHLENEALGANTELGGAAAALAKTFAEATTVNDEASTTAPPWQGPVYANEPEAADESAVYPQAKQTVAIKTFSAAKFTPLEKGRKISTPLSTQPDSALPDLGIIATEPRPASAAEKPARQSKTALWATANIVLIVSLLGQYAYFNRDELVKYPQLRPWLAQLCATIGCDIPLQRDVSRIVLANRLVESHPRFPNALLIDATLVNQADFTQPYPLLEIRFSDLNNQLVAGRRFRPSEYLPPDTSIKAGMPPQRQVHITLEIADPGKDAVSFQFELL